MKGTKRWRISEGLVLAALVVAAPLVFAATEAPAGFDNLTNGFTTQTQFNLDLASFDEFETIADGLGPVYNAQSCRECHQNPVSGATSQVTVCSPTCGCGPMSSPEPSVTWAGPM